MGTFPWRFSGHVHLVGDPRVEWQGYISHLAWERLGISQEELQNVSGLRQPPENGWLDGLLKNITPIRCVASANGLPSEL